MSYQLIYADPPWHYDNVISNGAAGNHYGTMSLTDLMRLPVWSIAAENAVLAMWYTGTQQKESDTNPYEKEPRESLVSNIKPVLALAIDPETPESYLRIPKRRRYENTKYTQWVKRQPCCGCGEGADDPHHITGNGFGGMATKAHDLFVIPLCRRCHDSLHEDVAAWEEEHGTQELLVLKTLDRALAIGVIATGKQK